jgi:hypothetical protein
MRFFSNVLSLVCCCIFFPLAIAAMITIGLAMVGITFVAFLIVTPFFLLEEARRHPKI